MRVGAVNSIAHPDRIVRVGVISAIGIETELHPDGIEAHIERHLALRRAGWNIVPLFRCEAFGHEEEAIAELVASRQGR